jgi:hypothetical protein
MKLKAQNPLMHRTPQDVEDDIWGPANQKFFGVLLRRSAAVPMLKIGYGRTVRTEKDTSPRRTRATFQLDA